MGQIVNNSRSFAREVLSTMQSTAREKIPAPSARSPAASSTTRSPTSTPFASTCVVSLPGNSSRLYFGEAETAALKPEKNVPVALQMRIGILLHQARSAGWIQPSRMACDRHYRQRLLPTRRAVPSASKTPPCPSSTTTSPCSSSRSTASFLPLGLVENLGWFTPLGSTVVGFMFLALDRIGRDLEDPFDNTIYDLPLTSIATEHRDQPPPDARRARPSPTRQRRPRRTLVSRRGFLSSLSHPVPLQQKSRPRHAGRGRHFRCSPIPTHRGSPRPNHAASPACYRSPEEGMAQPTAQQTEPRASSSRPGTTPRSG